MASKPQSSAKYVCASYYAVKGREEN